ncbi:MAG: hypothetical protein GYA59_12730 [Chloroflexi bacterium]|nr:hypothetical protein [Chloroflexota bacterium]
MLHQVLREIEHSQEPIALSALSRKLGIERSALDGMLAYWVRKGRLRDDDGTPIPAGSTCASGNCGSSCSGSDSCAFLAKMPKTYSLRLGEKPGKGPR